MMQAFSAWIAIALAPSASGGNLAERLGYPPDARVLILHADDLGMCHEGNAAGREALEAGTVSSGSVMVPCPWFPEFAAWARERPEWDLGVHLTLNSEWRGYRWGPVASSSEVPSLLDEEGYFYRDTRSLVQNARAEEVERECRAQVERALRFGIRPTHLDTHMGALFLRPDLFEVYYRLGMEYRLPILLPTPTEELTARFRERGVPVSDQLVERIRSGPLPTLDALNTGCASDDWETAQKAYRSAVRNLKPGVTQIILHLGKGGEEMRAITNSWRSRQNDLKVVSDPEFQKLLQEERVHQIGWRKVQRLVVEQLQ